MLSLNSPIVASDIYIVKALAPGHPVFQIEGFGDDHGKVDALVIKQEGAQAATNVKSATSLMNIVDRNARTIVLNPMEVQQLKLWAGGSELPDLTALRAAKELETQLGYQGAWVKMEVKKLTMLDEAVNKRLDANNPDKADVRLIAKGLRKSGGLEKLGEIIAADLFNGNSDRFGTPIKSERMGIASGPGGINLVTINNVGNVFFECSGRGSGKPIGLDSYDPRNEWKVLNNSALTGMTPTDFRWGGIVLQRNKKAEREEYAREIVVDMEALLGPRNRKIPRGTTNRLGTRRKARLVHGMDSGAKKIKRALQRWKRKNPPNDAHYTDIVAKMNALGW